MRQELIPGVARAVADAADAWKAGHDEVSATYLLEDAIQFALPLAKALARHQERAWRELFQGRKDYDSQGVGLVLRRCYDLAVRGLDRLAEAVALANDEGYRVDGVEEFQAARQSVQQLAAEFTEKWPLFTAEEIEAGAARIATGEFFTLEEARRELDGANRP